MGVRPARSALPGALAWNLGGTLRGDRRDSPMMEMGFRAKRSRPQTPTYLLRQPADQRRTTYSVPKNTTSTISCGDRTVSSPRGRPAAHSAAAPGLPAQAAGSGRPALQTRPRGRAPRARTGSGAGRWPDQGLQAPARARAQCGARAQAVRPPGSPAASGGEGPSGVRGHHWPRPERRGRVNVSCDCHGGDPCHRPGSEKGCAPCEPAAGDLGKAGPM